MNRPPTRAQIERELRKGGESAILIEAAQGRATSKEIPVIVTKDDGTTVETKTKSAPWMLGHGQWIIGLHGFIGGYDCARVRLIPENKGGAQ